MTTVAGFNSALSEFDRIWKTSKNTEDYNITYKLITHAWIWVYVCNEYRSIKTINLCYEKRTCNLFIGV